MKTQAVPYTAVYTALRASRVSLPRLMSLIYGQHQLTHQFCHCDSGWTVSVDRCWCGWRALSAAVQRWIQGKKPGQRQGRREGDGEAEETGREKRSQCSSGVQGKMTHSYLFKKDFILVVFFLKKKDECGSWSPSSSSLSPGRRGDLYSDVGQRSFSEHSAQRPVGRPRPDGIHLWRGSQSQTSRLQLRQNQGKVRQCDAAVSVASGGIMTIK